MKTPLLLSTLILMLASCGVRAQAVQNMDIFFLAGPAVIGSHTLAGSNVSLYGRTALGVEIGYGYQIAHMSAASLWIELIPTTSVVQALGSASIPGTVNDDLLATTVGLRLMVPLQSRVSVYGAAGGGSISAQDTTISTGSNPSVSSHDAWHGVFAAGGGIDLRLRARFSIRAELRDFVTGTRLSGAAGRNHLVPFFGVAFHF